MYANKFKGTGVALITPFKQDKSIDFSALEYLVNHVIENGVQYVVALGTTAETPTLNSEEKKDILKCVVDVTQKRVPVVCGIGGNDTQEVINNMQQYDLNNVDAILSVTPYYNKPTQQGLLAHYKAIDLCTSLPIILYNVPGRTGVNMSAETTLTLANECKNFIAVKEASGNMVQCMELMLKKPKDFLLLSGDDNLVLPQIALGFDGVISVAANCFTKLFSQMVQDCLENKYEQAREAHYQLLHGIDLLFAQGNPAGVKAVLHQMQLCENELRLPLVPVSDALYNEILLYLKK